MDTVETNVKELASNRWMEIFGTEENSRYDFLDYQAKRFYFVRGHRVEISEGQREPATDKYLQRLIIESKYWEHKDEIKTACEYVDNKAVVADNYIYRPVAKQIIENSDRTRVLFNTYESPKLIEKPATGDEIQLWGEFWKYLLKDGTERNRVQQWIANLAFKPEQRTGVAVLLHGKSTGTGKGTLGEILTELVGRSNTAKPENPAEALTNKFNAVLEGKVLIIVDELYAGGSFKLADGIKSKITEPSLEVEPKGKEMRKIDNYCNFFASSNDLTPLWLDGKDRRWEVYEVEYSDETEEQHKAATRAFRKWFETDREHAVAVIRSILKSVDLSDYKPWSTGAMETEAKRKLINNSVSSKQDDFELYWNQNSFNDGLVVNASMLFVNEWRSIPTGKRADILTNLGCQKLNSNTSVKIGKDQSRVWWITPKGLTCGIHIYMNGKEIGEVLEIHRSDVTVSSYDDASETLTVNTRTQF
jgi:hypothetical protein